MDLKTCKKYIDWMLAFYKYCRDNGELDYERRNHTITVWLSRAEYDNILRSVPNGKSISEYLRNTIFARMHDPRADHVDYDMVKASRTIAAGISMTSDELTEFDKFCKGHKTSRMSMARKLIFN